MTEAKAMTVAEIRAKLAEAKILTLPSGLTVKVRRLTPMDYIKEGLSQIPNEFYKFVVELQAGAIDFNGDETKRKDNFDIFEKFVNITIEKGVIEPKMVFKYEEEKKDTHLLYTELSSLDQTALLNAVVGK